MKQSWMIFRHFTVTFFFGSYNKRMSRKISDLDQRIQAFTHLSDQQKLDAVGGCHDVLFLLKCFDLDIKMHYPLGSVLGYAIPGFPCNVLIEDEKPEE